MSSGKRKLPWLKERSANALSSRWRNELVGLARGMAPNSAYNTARELAYVRTGDITFAEETAKSCRFLAMIRRDYSSETFEQFVSLQPVFCSRPKDTNQKGTSVMSTISNSTSVAQSPQQGALPSLPLKHISFRAAVNSAFARVKCVQSFQNDAQNPVEAIYVFPIPDDASVTACTMVIGDRRVEAELKTRKEARQEYDDAVAQGHYASLLEQERPNIFTMNVGGIEPGQAIEVEVDYVQRVPWQAGGGRFSVPLVVPPRFIPGKPTGKQSGGWADDTDEVTDASRITPVVAKEGVSYNADISVMFSPGFDCRVSSPSHSFVLPGCDVLKGDTAEYKTEDILADRDFVMVYASLSSVPELAVHKGSFKGEEFVLASIIPPGSAPVTASDIVCVLDCSGSMSDSKISGLKVIAKNILRNLRLQNVGHCVGVLPFDNSHRPSYPVSEISEATEKFIDGLEAHGGTELGPALDAANKMFAENSRPKVILLVTDGQTESLRFKKAGVRIIVVGIDTSINDTAIKDLARQTNGTCETVYPGEDYSAVSARMTGYLSGPVLQQVSVQAEGDVVGVSDVFSGRPATIAIRLKDKTSAISVKGKNPQGAELSWQVKFDVTKECDFAAQIWARDFIRENPDKKLQTEASLKYGVICKHTSFVAVSLKEVPGQKPERCEIPVSLPHGWDFDSVFGGVSAGPLRTKSALVSSDFAVLGASADIDDIELEACSDGIGSMLQDFKTGSRFCLDAPDVVDRLIAVLVIISKDREAAEKAFVSIKQELTVEAVRKLSDEKRAMARYFALRLWSYGLSLDFDVMLALQMASISVNDIAVSWFNLSLKETGRPFRSVLVPGDGSDYCAWKFGMAQRPDLGDWIIVP